MAPSDVMTQRKAKVWFRLYADPVVCKEPSLRVGDSVRISKARRTFKKGYLAQWIEEIFTIVKRKSTHPPTFVLTDYSGEVLKRTFYPQELGPSKTWFDVVVEYGIPFICVWTGCMVCDSICS